MLADIGEEDVHNWEAKLMAGGTYPAGDDVMEVAKEAYLKFFSTNPLYTSIFKSLAQMERDIIEMTASLHHGDDATGSVTSGGSESILMGVKIARDRARHLHPEIDAPEMIVPFSAHPAFTKAAHYFGLTVVEAPLRADLELDVDAYKRLIDAEHRADGRLGARVHPRHGRPDRGARAARPRAQHQLPRRLVHRRLLPAVRGEARLPDPGLRLPGARA